MTITAEDLAKLSPLAKKVKRTTKKTAVDLLKVADVVIKASDALVSGEGDVAEKIEAFNECIDGIGDLLEKAFEGEDGTVYVDGSDEDVAKALGGFSSENPGDEGDEGGATTVNKSLEGLSDEDLADELEDGGWPEDLSPKTSATIMKNARLTKGERPVPARPGARGRVQKRYASARDTAFGRDASDRCMK